MLLASLLLLTCCQQADVLCLTDGRFVVDKRLEATEDGVDVHFENGTVHVPQRMILDYVTLESLTYEPRNEEEREKFTEGLVRFEGRWMREDRRTKLIEKRIAKSRADLQERVDHGQWSDRYQEDSKHFSFQYTVPPHIFEGYRDAMEAYFELFKKDWRVRVPKKSRRLSVCFYNDRKSYNRTSGAKPNVVGYFRFVDPMELNIYYDRLDPDYTEDVMFHEANHYLQKLIDLSFKIPHFPGESVAEYYGASSWDPETGRFETGLVQEGRLAEIQTDIAKGDYMSLERLVSTAKMYEHYTWGWSLIYFLMQDPEREKRFKKFFKGLASARDIQRTEPDRNYQLTTVKSDEIWRAFKKYMKLEKEEELRDFERAWHDFIDEELAVVSARGLQKAARKAEEQERKIRAKRLYREAIEKGAQSPSAFHQLADLLAKDGDFKQAHELWDRAMEIDPLMPDAYAAKGRTLIMQGEDTKEEGIRLILLAREMGLEKELENVNPDDLQRKDKPPRGN